MLNKFLYIVLILAGITLPSMASGFSFPEIAFCPLGGPPGWFNRMTGQHDRRYYAPPPRVMRPVYPPVAPYGWQSPVMQQPPLYFPVTPPEAN